MVTVEPVPTPAKVIALSKFDADASNFTILSVCPLLVDANDELNVEYPVVEVISICTEPETTVSAFNLVLTLASV